MIWESILFNVSMDDFSINEYGSNDYVVLNKNGDIIKVAKNEGFYFLLGVELEVKLSDNAATIGDYVKKFQETYPKLKVEDSITPNPENIIYSYDIPKQLLDAAHEIVQMEELSVGGGIVKYTPEQKKKMLSTAILTAIYDPYVALEYGIGKDRLDKPYEFLRLSNDNIEICFTKDWSYKYSVDIDNAKIYKKYSVSDTLKITIKDKKLMQYRGALKKKFADKIKEYNKAGKLKQKQKSLDF